MAIISLGLLLGLAVLFFVMRRGDPKWRRVVKSFGELLRREEFDQALALLPEDPQDPYTRTLRGWCLLLVGRTEDGLALLRRGEDGELPHDPRARMDMWIDQARAFALTNSDAPRATALVSKIKRAMTQLPDSWHADIEARLAEVEGWMQLHREQALHALVSFDRAVERPTEMPFVNAARLYGRACALIELGRRGEGILALKDAAALGPDRPNCSRAHALLEELGSAGAQTVAESPT